MDQNCASPRHFLFPSSIFLNTPEICDKVHQARKTDCTAERAVPLPRETGNNCRCSRTHRHTHTHNCTKEALAPRFGRHGDGEVRSRTVRSTTRRLGEVHSSDTRAPHVTRHVVSRARLSWTLVCPSAYHGGLVNAAAVVLGRGVDGGVPSCVIPPWQSRTVVRA